MQLEYRILWIEDNSIFVDSVKEELEGFISQKGFIPIVESPNSDELETLIDQDLSSYDLMLIDYKLSNNSYSKEDGGRLIEKIRQRKLYNNIIFYSSDVEKLRTLNLPGVFILDRGSIIVEKENDFCSMISFFLEKDMNLNTMRGIVLSEVAGFDRKIMEILKKRSDKEKICEFTKIRIHDFNDNVQKMDTPKLWEKVKGSSGTVYFQSRTRSDFLFEQNFIKTTELPEIKDIYGEVLSIRNKLAHQESPKIDFVEYRKKLIKIKKCLNQTSEKL